MASSPLARPATLLRENMEAITARRMASKQQQQRDTLHVL